MHACAYFLCRGDDGDWPLPPNSFLKCAEGNKPEMSPDPDWAELESSSSPMRNEVLSNSGKSAPGQLPRIGYSGWVDCRRLYVPLVLPVRVEFVQAGMYSEDEGAF